MRASDTVIEDVRARNYVDAGPTEHLSDNELKDIQETKSKQRESYLKMPEFSYSASVMSHVEVLRLILINVI